MSKKCLDKLGRTHTLLLIIKEMYLVWSQRLFSSLVFITDLWWTILDLFYFFFGEYLTIKHAPWNYFVSVIFIWISRGEEKPLYTNLLKLSRFFLSDLSVCPESCSHIKSSILLTKFPWIKILLFLVLKHLKNTKSQILKKKKTGDISLTGSALE